MTLPVRGLLLAAAACSLYAAAPAAAEDMSRSQVESIIKEYLVANPDVVVEALKAYDAQQATRQQETFTQRLKEKHDAVFKSEAPFIGNEKGDITVVEFFDYNCGYCKKAIDGITKLVEEDKNVRFVFFDLPILGESSRMASQWALAAERQGKYFPYHQALMKFSGMKDEENLSKIAKDVGLDVDKLKKDAADPAITQRIDEHVRLAQELGISGTPGFIFGEVLVPGYTDYEGMKATLDQARARMKEKNNGGKAKE